MKIPVCSKCLMKGSGGIQIHTLLWVTLRNAAQHSHPKSHSGHLLHRAAALSLCPRRECVNQVGMWEPDGNVLLGCSHPQALCYLLAKWRTPRMQGALRQCSCSGTQCWPWILRFATKGAVELAGTKENWPWSKNKGNEILRGYSQEQLKSAACWRWSSLGRRTGLLTESLLSHCHLHILDCGQQQDWTSLNEKKSRTRQITGCHLGSLLKQDKA